MRVRKLADFRRAKIQNRRFLEVLSFFCCQTAVQQWLLRASNTQPDLILRAEAKNKNDLEFLIKDYQVNL